MGIRIVECVCANGHSLMGMAYEGDLDVQSAKKLHEAMAKVGIPLVCDLCRSTAFTYPDQETSFRTTREAMEFLKQRGDMPTVKTQQEIDVDRYRKIMEN